MADTVRVTREPEYYPFVDDYALRYQHTSTRFEGVEQVDLVLTDVRAFRDDATARAVLTRLSGGEVRVATFTVRRNARQVCAEGGVLGISRQEFPIPALPGMRWTEGSETHEVAGVDAAIDAPAGKFLRCLCVRTLFDGGSSLRYYAPGVGCVYEERAERDGASRVELERFGVRPGKP